MEATMPDEEALCDAGQDAGWVRMGLEKAFSVP